MLQRLFIITILTSCIIFVGCAQLPQEEVGVPQEYGDLNDVLPPSLAIPQSSTKQKLLTQYQEWQGTPYRYNQVNRKGIDCSGFMLVTFQEKFDINLPRTTEEQVKVGTTITKNKLQVGDLVFFKTGRYKRHVGVYLGEGMFLHASTKAGVTISNLSNPYWKSSYWLSKRIIS